MGKLVEIKTKPTSLSVKDFVNIIADEQKTKLDSLIILKLMEKATKESPQNVGRFNDWIWKYQVQKSLLREEKWIGSKLVFHRGKLNLSLHLINLQQHADALDKLGKHKTERRLSLYQ